MPPSERSSPVLPVTAARHGDASAWDVLFHRYQLPLYTFVESQVGQRAASVDIVQETFIAAVRHLPSLRDDARFGSWLFGIAHQKCLQHARRAGREVPLDDRLADLPDDDVPDPRDLLLEAEQASTLLTLIDELPPPQRTVLVLHLLEDFSLLDIATITGAPLGTVKSRLRHAKHALRIRLNRSSHASPLSS